MVSLARKPNFTPSIVMAIAVLRIRAILDAIVQRGLQHVVGRPRNVEVLVDDDPGDPLTGIAAHNPRFARVKSETLVLRNVFDGSQERVDLACERPRRPRTPDRRHSACIFTSKALARP